MNYGYDTRVRLIGEWLMEILKRYTPPQGIDNETLRKEMNLIVLDINSAMPNIKSNEQFKLFADKLDKNLRANHRSRSWPIIRTFVEAAYAAGKQAHIPNPTEHEPFNPIQNTAKRILNGEAVGDGYLWGSLATKLLMETDVEEADLDAYREAYTAKLDEAYGEEHTAIHINKLKDNHRHALAQATKLQEIDY